MNQKKTLQELTIKDNFMFGAVMSDAENCRGLLEITLGFPIARVEVNLCGLVTTGNDLEQLRKILLTSLWRGDGSVCRTITLPLSYTFCNDTNIISIR